MDLFFDDLVNGLVHQVQGKVVPRLEQASQHAGEHIRRTAEAAAAATAHGQIPRRRGRRPRPPPSTTDIVYVTDRLLVSSQAAMAAQPTFLDTGRDQNSTVTWTTRNTNTNTTDDANALERDDGAAAEMDVAMTIPDSSDHSIVDKAPSEGGGRVDDDDGSVVPLVDKKQVVTITTDNVNPQDGTADPLAEARSEVVAEEEHDPVGKSLGTGNVSNDLDGVDMDAGNDRAAGVVETTNDNGDDNSDGEGVAGSNEAVKDDSIHPDPGTTAVNWVSDSPAVADLGTDGPEEVKAPATGDDDKSWNPNDDDADNADASNDVPVKQQKDHYHQTGTQPTSRPISHHGGRILNSPVNMVDFLDRQHGPNHHLSFSLTSETPDDRTLIVFRRQIIQLGWWSPCLERSETPSIPKVLKACYAIHAFLQLDPSNVALVYCVNGKTRTTIVVACYLKFAGIVEHSSQGFVHVLSKRGTSQPESVLQQVPPSLQLFFHQFDQALEYGGFLNRKPLLLRAIALQGIPVEDQPCLDIWDSSQQHVYSSHPEMWPDDSALHCNMSIWHGVHGKPLSQWVDEEGFYQVNAVLEGDFVLLCRFGGDFASETKVHDPTKILFRYTNTTGFLSAGSPYELSSRKIDLTRRYADQFDDEDFLVTLLFEADWEQIESDQETEVPAAISKRLTETSDVCDEQVWKRQEEEACDVGLRVIFECHSARPTTRDIDAFKHCHNDRNFQYCSDELILLALKLTNIDNKETLRLLLESPMLSWWQVEPSNGIESTDVHEAKEEGKDDHIVEDENRNDAEKRLRGINESAVDEIMTILDEVEDDISKNLNPADRIHFERLAKEREGDHGCNYGEESQQNDSNDLCLKDTGWMVPSMLYPRQGDIVGAFAASGGVAASAQNVEAVNDSTYLAVAKARPRMPYFLRNKPNMLPPPSKRVRHGYDDGEKFGPHRVPLYEPSRAAAMEVYSQLRHTGVTLDGLTNLSKESRGWSNIHSSIDYAAPDTEQSDPPTQEVDAALLETKDPSSMNREAKEKKERQWNNDQKAEAKEKQKAADEQRQSEDGGEEVNNGESAPTADDLPLAEDARFAKYFKMLKLGMRREQVLHALKRDDHDPAILDMDSTKSLKSQQPSKDICVGDDPPLNKDEKYSKYFKMLKLGMPREQVLHAIKRDEVDPLILDLDPNKSLKSQQVKNAVSDCDDADPPLKDDPKYTKYFRMLKMQLPMGAVKNALVRDGLDPAIMDLDHNKSVKGQLGRKADEEKDIGVPLKDDPEFTKYFKMEKMGLPRDAVRNALVRDGLDPAIIDLDPNKSVAFQLKKKKTAPGMAAATTPKKSLKKKKKVRRKKIYWNPIDPGKLNEDSMWNIVRDAVTMDKLNYDQQEFEELFTESADASQQNKVAPKKEAKKLVQVIDPKRSMNGGIVLARMKTGLNKIAEYVDRMEHGKFDPTQLKALKEYLPDADERRGLIAYMKKGEKSEEEESKLFADLSETEKYMVTLMDVEDAGPKLDAMMFRSVFKSRCEDITAGTKTLNSACDELRSSEKLRKLMAVILTVVNQINTGGEGKVAMGFTLDALLKLNEAKAFDKKTSVLHYVVKLVKKNDESLLTFDNDICHVIPAESVLLDSVSSDVNALREELDGVLEIVQKEAGRLEEQGELRKMSISELSEQRTMVQNVGSLQHFNKMEHLTGRTPMERFTLTAKVACESAEETILEVKRKYTKVLNYFGEDENMATGDFFGILRRFMAEFKKAIEQVEKIERAQTKEKKRAAARAAKEAKRGKKEVSKSKPLEKQGLGRGGVAALAAQAARKKNEVSASKSIESDSGPVNVGSVAAMAAMAAQENRMKAEKKSPSPGGIAALAAEAARKKSEDNDRSKRTRNVPVGVTAALDAETAEKKSQAKNFLTTDEAIVGGIAALAAQASLRRSQKETEVPVDPSSSEHTSNDPLVSVALDADDDKSMPAHVEQDEQRNGDTAEASVFASKAAAYRKKKEHKDDGDKLKEDGNSKFLSSLSSYRKKIKAKTFSERKLDSSSEVEPQGKQQQSADNVINDDKVVPSEKTSTEHESPLSVASPKTSRPTVERKAPSLGDFLERSRVPAENAFPVLEPIHTNPMSLGSFLDRKQSHEIRSEVLRQNFDDTSVAIMAETLEQQPVYTHMNEDVWDEGGGISDFLGWADQAIRSSDTESVAAFEESQQLDFQQDYDDESTIATYYDDDASIASSVITPRQRDHFSFENFDALANANGAVATTGERTHPSVTPAKVAAMLFDSDTDSSVAQHHDDALGYPASNQQPVGQTGDEMLNMALTFNDVGMDAGLSFGADVGLDDGLGFGGVEDGLGGFGMTSSVDPSSRQQAYGISSLSMASLHALDASLQPFGVMASSLGSPPASSNRSPTGESSDRKKAAASKWFQWGKGS